MYHILSVHVLVTYVYYVHSVGFEFVARNGWFILIGVVVLFLLWRVSSHLYDLYDNWRESSKKKGKQRRDIISDCYW